MAEIIAGEYWPTMWKQGCYTITRQFVPGAIAYTICNHVKGGVVKFTAGADYLASYHNEKEIKEKWEQQREMQKRARWVTA